jgi:hypothetical protein
VRLFQIEEPGGGPTDPNEPGAAIAIEATGASAEVAFSVGGNALILDERPGFEQALPVPAAGAGAAAWQELLEGARIRAERALARPVTHAIVVLALAPDAAMTGHLRQASERAGLELLRITWRGELPAGPAAALTAAVLAEDLAPRRELATAPGPG